MPLGARRRWPGSRSLAERRESRDDGDEVLARRFVQLAGDSLRKSKMRAKR